MLAAIQSPSPADEQREQTLYRYRIFGTELEPDWREAIELASQRTRQQEGLIGDSSVQLQPGATGEFLADSPIAHFRWGADGARNIVAVTRTDEIWQALSDVRARLREQNPLPHSPELRIEALSPQEWQAHQQALREANRLGISTHEAQQVARFAAANAGTGRIDETSAPQAVIDAKRLRASANDAVMTDPEPARLARAAVAMPSAAERVEPIPAFNPREQAPDAADAAQVAALDAKHGRNFDAVSERMSTSLLVLAKDNGLTHVDYVVLSGATADKSAGYNLFVVQGELDNPAHLRAAMPTAQAAQTSVDESIEHLDVVTREQQQRVQAQQVEQQMHDDREQQVIQSRAASMG